MVWRERAEYLGEKDESLLRRIKKWRPWYQLKKEKEIDFSEEEKDG